MSRLALVHNRPTATRRRVDICEVVEELRRQNPRMGADRIGVLLAERIEEDRHLLISAGRFIAEKVLAATAARAKLRRAAPTPKERVERHVAEKAAVRKIAAKVREIALLDRMVTLATGEQKQFRYCLGAEIGQLGFGYSRIAERVGPKNMVGEVMVEAEVKALLQRATI